MIETVLREKLLSIDTVATAVVDRVRIGTLDQSEPLPAIRFFSVAGEELPNLDGTVDHEIATIQIDVLAMRHLDAAAIFRSIQTTLRTWASPIAGGCVIECSLSGGPRHAAEDPAEGSADSVYIVSGDFDIHFTLSIPEVTP